MSDFRPMEALLLQGCLIAIVVIGLLAAVLLLWVKRGR